MALFTTRGSGKAKTAIFATEPDAFYTFTQGYGGVSRYDVVVSVKHVESGRPYAGVLHMFVKALTTDRNTTQLRAMVWLEPEDISYGEASGRGVDWARDRVRRDGVLSNAPEVTRLNLVLESVLLGLRQPLEISTWPCVGGGYSDADGETCDPHPSEDKGHPVRMGDVRIDLGTRALATDGWRIRVVGADARTGGTYVPLSRAIARARVREAPRSPPTVVHVAHPAPRAAFSARAFLHHVTYHRAVGIAGTLAYATDDVLTAAERDPALVKLAARGVLRFVRWQRALVNGTLVDPYVAVAYGYAVLSFWGTGKRLMFTDSDEILALPVRRVPLSALLERGGCLAQPCALLPRFDAFTERAISASGSAAWLRGTSTAAAAKELAWRNERRSAKGRIIVDPDAVASVGEHDAAVCVGRIGVLDAAAASIDAAEEPATIRSPCAIVRRCQEISPGCVRLLHHVNLFGRNQEPLDVVKDVSWTWVLR